jgi:glucose-1-phosphate adenylyltransferase
MGNDLYLDESSSKPGDPPIGIERNAVIEGAIIDKNARIGNEVVITPEGKPANMAGDNY